MLYRINRINRSVELNDELVNIYLKCDEIHEQIFSIVIRSKYGHAPTVDEVSDEELSALCNEILFSELKVLALLPNAIMTIYNNYEEYTENTYIELPIDDAFKIIAELVDSKAKLRASKNE